MGLRAFWQQYREKLVHKLLASRPQVVREVLQRDPGLANAALHSMYSSDTAFVTRMNEIEAASHGPERTTYPFPVLTSLGFGGRQPLTRTLPKLTPFAMRRFSEIPPARRAINAIKMPILDMPFTIGLKKPIGARRYDADPEPTEEQHARIKAATAMLMRPNDEYTGREFLELGVEDLLVFGAMAFEDQENDTDERPLFLWDVDSQSIRINVRWQPGSKEFRYSQARGYLFGAAGTSDDVQLQDEDLCYVRLNPRTSSPFGLGYLEIAFGTVNAYIGSFEFAERRASNSTPPYMIFLGENVVPEQVQRFRGFWENEIEGFGKIPIVGGGRAPSVHPFIQAGTDPLWIQWQEFLIRIISISFGISPMRLGLERDINRSTADQGASDDWATIAPVANTVREAFTHWLLWKRLGWMDLEFTWQIKTSDEMKQAQVLAVQWESDAIYVDELRQVYERPPLPDGLGQMTMTAYQAAIKAAAGMPAAGDGIMPSVESDGAVSPFSDVEDKLLSPQERAFLREAVRERRRRVAG